MAEKMPDKGGIVNESEAVTVQQGSIRHRETATGVRWVWSAQLLTLMLVGNSDPSSENPAKQALQLKARRYSPPGTPSAKRGTHIAAAIGNCLVSKSTQQCDRVATRQPLQHCIVLALGVALQHQIDR